MEQKIIANCSQKETRVALLEDNKVVEAYISRPLQKRLIGNVYKGVVENVLPGMQAAFVNIGEGKNAFLYIDEVPLSGGKKAANSSKTIQRLLRPGQELMVQVVKESFGSKGSRLTGHITLPGRFLVLAPGHDFVGVSRRIRCSKERDRLKKEAESLKTKAGGIIVRTAAEGASRECLQQDLKFLLRLLDKIRVLYKKETGPALLHRDVDLLYRVLRDIFNDRTSQFIIDNEHEYNRVREILRDLSPHLEHRVFYYNNKEPIFERFNIEAEIERALKRMVWLSCGGYLVFDETEALMVVDVNTGKYTGRNNLEETILKTNLEAAAEIARQIRLRDIGGIIVVDFIDMASDEHREQVLEKLKEHMSRDRTRTQISGITSLGLVEITRKRVRQGLSAAMHQPCSYCHGKGKMLSPEAISSMVERELKKILQRRDVEAVLVEMNSEAAALLIGSGGLYLKKLEKETGKNIFIRGSDDMHPEKYKVVMSGGLQEVERQSLPVEEGGIYRVKVESQHSSNPEHGIARLHGYILDIDGAGELVGEEALIVIKETTRTFARAVLWERDTSREEEEAGEPI